jgi:hypothetical protein
MNGQPLLGGVSEKLAAGYLLRPKKKRKKKQTKEQEAEKVAAAWLNAQLDFNARVQSGDLGGGWNPLDQIKRN